MIEYGISDGHIKRKLNKDKTLKIDEIIYEEKVAPILDPESEGFVNYAANRGRLSCSCKWCSEKLKRSLRMNYESL